MRTSLRTLAPLAAACLLAGLWALPADAEVKASAIKKAFKSRDADKVRGVLEELKGSLNKKQLKAIVKDAKRLRSLGLYDTLVATLGSAEGEARKELIRSYKKAKNGNVRFLVVDAIGRLKGKEAEKELIKILKKDKAEPVRVLAARLMGKRNTASAVDALIPVLEELEQDEKEARMAREVLGALQALTGRPIALAKGWKSWWGAHRKKYTTPERKEGEEGKSSARSNLIKRMSKARPGDLKTIRRVRDDDLVVIKGNDKVEQVLEALDLKHKLIQRGDFDSMKLDPVRQLILLNCPGKDSFSDAGIQKIREFVAKGGYLFCSDWELKKTLAKAFPEVVSFLKESPRGKNRTVTIRPHPQGGRHPLMRDVFPLNTFDDRGFAWVLEQRSHLAKPNKALIPLVICPEIKNLGTTTVAFTFSFRMAKGRPVTGGKKKHMRSAGRVLFVSSHFKLQKDEKGDGFALQQLVLNFILEKQQQRKVLKGLKALKKR